MAGFGCPCNAVESARQCAVVPTTCPVMPSWATLMKVPAKLGLAQLCGDDAAGDAAEPSSFEESLEAAAAFVRGHASIQTVMVERIDRLRPIQQLTLKVDVMNDQFAAQAHRRTSSMLFLQRTRSVVSFPSSAIIPQVEQPIDSHVAVAPHAGGERDWDEFHRGASDSCASYGTGVCRPAGRPCCTGGPALRPSGRCSRGCVVLVSGMLLTAARCVTQQVRRKSSAASGLTRS